MEENYPPYTITDKMLNLATKIMEKIGEANYFESLNRYPELRRKTRIKSIHSSLAIENNQLSFFQVEAVINGKAVIGEQRDIQEVKNAYKAYEELDTVNPLILSSIFHYEFVFIHPFSDGNGRTARLWQTAILAYWKELFKYIPIESIIRKHQEGYYTAIQNCNNAGNSNEFIEFMLEVINEAVDGMILEQQEITQETTKETTQEKILNLIKKNPSITQVEMAKILKLTRDGISYNIKILKDNGIIERQGSTKNGIWKLLK